MKKYDKLKKADIVCSGDTAEEQKYTKEFYHTFADFI